MNSVNNCSYINLLKVFSYYFNLDPLFSDPVDLDHLSHFAWFVVNYLSTLDYFVPTVAPFVLH